MTFSKDQRREGRRGDTLLFLSAHLPSSRAKEAGQRLAYDHLSALAGRYRVELVAFASKGEMEAVDVSVYEMCDAVYLFPLNHLRRLIGIVLRLDLPFYVALRHSASIRRLLARICQDNSDLLVWIEYSQMGQYCEVLGDAQGIVLGCQDVLGQLFERWSAAARGVLRAVLSWERKRICKWEARMLRSVHKVLVLSKKDLDILRGYGVKDIVIGYPAPALGPAHSRTRDQDAPPTIVFFGAMNRLENIDAVNWFLAAIYPLIKRAIFDVRFLVGGANPREDLIAVWNRIEGVTVTGFVSEPWSLFNESWVAIAPMRMGAGLKIKVLQYLSCGLPVVATQIGAEGIPADREAGLWVADTAMEIAEICVALLSDRARCEAAGAAARNWYVNEYKPRELTADRLVEILEGARCQGPSNSLQSELG